MVKSHRPDPCKYCAAKYRHLQEHPTSTGYQNAAMPEVGVVLCQFSYATKKSALVSYLDFTLGWLALMKMKLM